MGISRLFIFALALSFSAAHAQKPFTNMNAAKQNALSTMAQGGITFVLNRINRFTTTQLVSRSVEAKMLTDDEINRIMFTVEDSWSKNFGIGQIGGDRVTVEYDAPQAARMAGVRNAHALDQAYKKATAAVAGEGANVAAVADAESLNLLATEMKPEYQAKEINTRTSTDLRSELAQLTADKVTVRSVTFRGLLLRQGQRVLGTLQVMFLAGAGSNAAFSAYYAYNGLNQKVDTWQADRCTQVEATNGSPNRTVCNQPNLLTYLFNTSDAIYYRFYADQ